MYTVSQFIHILLHLDIYLNILVQHFGLWSYFILFLIFFCESGVILTPFLPGDSLLFALGALCARGIFHLPLLWVTLVVACVFGGSVNYLLGKWFGKKIIQQSKNKLLKKYLQQTHTFYEKYGAKTIVWARFFPIIRTYAPFLAGASQMEQHRFMIFNAFGGIAWISLLLSISYYLGNIPAIKNNFSLVIVMIMIVSLLPAFIEILRAREKKS